MIRYRIVEEHPTTRHLYGATMGQAHLRGMLIAFARGTSGDGENTLVLDFTDVESATASYLKATVLWLLEAGRLAAEEVRVRADAEYGSASEPRPLAVFPMVVALNDEIRGEFDELLDRQGRACFEVVRWGGEQVAAARLHGKLDPSLRWALEALTRERRATAGTLHERYAADPHAAARSISANAWNNRLTDLYRMRLASRVKDGRHWIYQPMAAEVVDG